MNDLACKKRPPEHALRYRTVFVAPGYFPVTFSRSPIALRGAIVHSSPACLLFR